ncbi:MAG: LamG domain-containing protein, partial [Candidatus Aenigmarchaeota archaeon]|nr:LamG domain-containing protein [Candidatus Aenigmarchaeota archaeon]
MRGKNMLGAILMFFAVGLIFISPTFSSPTINFVPPTEPNGTTIYRNWTEVNITIDDPDGNLDTFKFNWNGTNYTFYDDSLVLALNFNNNSAIGENSTYAVDISEYGNNGTIHGATWTTNGKFGSALDFDGVDDYVNCGNDSSLDITDEITIEAWVKIDAWVNNLPRIVAKKDAYSLYFNATKHEVVMAIYHDNIGKFVEANQTLSLNTWYHIAGIYNNSTSFKIYINGVEANLTKDIGTTGTIDSNTNDVLIGQYEGLNRYFNGTIDEVRIYNRALSEDEIKMHYLSEFQKYNSTQWRFYSNVTGLVKSGSYTYYGWANDTGGNSAYTTNYTAESPRILNVNVTPKLSFVSPTEENGTTIYRSWTEVNITIDDQDGNLDTFKFNWNGTNYTFMSEAGNSNPIYSGTYDNLKLGMTFNENGNTATDYSKYGNNG